jgi:uncharacterized protein (TIGR02996 family)
VKTRRLEHAGKNRFWEVFWEEREAETVTGVLGTKGRARRHFMGSPMLCKEFVETEVAVRTRQGFVEVLPEVVQSKAAPQAESSPEWLARIAESFDDDQPRQVYADWLQTKGDPLGELIAVQCERARIDAWDPKHKALRDREEHLLETFRARWLPSVVGAELTFHRGFAERVRIELPFQLDVLERVLAGAPLVRTLELVESREPWRTPHTQLPWELPLPTPLQHLTGLFVRGHKLDTSQVRALIDFPDLARLDRLGLRSCGLGAAGLKIIGERRWRELDLHDNVYGARGLEHLIEHAAQLVALDVGSAGIGDDGALLLASAPLTALTRLSLRRSELTARSLGPLARSPKLAALRALDLSCNALGADELAALVDHVPAAHGPGGGPALRSLVELDLRETGLGDAGVIALARSALATQLVSLELGQNAIGEAGARALADARLPALRYLNASGNPLGDAGARLKAAFPHARVVARARAVMVPP